ncbi:SCO family protein [Vibrio furnissii]|uniref:Photosynthetic protein synthase I n=1 Tax=Vibrio furnissii TaxID=29494 RepID=A0A0Q2R6M0_VIBFU|nr:SCO family protein [Vibrio furnissii]ADT89243.1 SCO1/SenC family protein [Vibrio furnissii NCTC 11218]KQH87757.1 photosynthetic protein synthase I [Vibrio furnissii]MCG6234378.1 SCO family protein [Vibrio furnissii]MCG6260430.1 SCO family protein [Vibrio furnissii]MCG6269464.1 SCO family protein [Vibrio furnissii]
MSKNWSLILVVAFVLGFGFKSYLDAQPEPTNLADSPTVTLFGQDNQAVNIFDASDPRIRIVYFGFTRCPDVCPTSLAMLAGALNELDADTQSQVRPMFVSLDPERDNAQASATYAHYFHPMIEGLSAPLDVTTALAHRYGVIFRKTELPNSELKYTLDHSSYFYFLQPDGTLITKVPHTQNPAPIVDAIKKTINTSKG